MSKTHSPSVPASIAVALGLVTLLGPAAIDMYLPSIPVIASDMGTNYAAVQITLTVFLLAMGAGQLFFGPVIDTFGRRRPLLIAIVAFIASSVWAASAQSVESLIFARSLQGLAASLALVTAMSSVRDVAEGVAAAQLFALLMTVQGLGPVLAPALGGLIGEWLGWRAVFLTLAALGVVVLINTVIQLRETLPLEKRASLNVMSVMGTYVEIVSFRAFLLPALSLSFAFFFLFAYIGGAAYAYQTGYGLSSRDFGLVFGATGFAVLVGAMGSGKLVTRFRIEMLALSGVLAMFIGAIIGLVSALTSIGLPGIVVGMFIALGGLGISEATLMSIAFAARNTALGASAAILGAFPLMVGAASTSLSAIVVELGVVHWLCFLTVAGLMAVILTLASVRMVAKSGMKVELQH